MNPIATSKKWLFFALILLTAGLLSACAGVPRHEWLEAPGWGRARLIGETRSAYPVRPALDAEGNSYFATSHIEANVPIVRVSALDERVEPVWQVEFPLERLRRANKPSIVLSSRGLEIFWILDNGLYSAILDLEGNVLSQPRRISGNRVAVYYVVALNASGERILWFSGARSLPGTFAIDAGGNIASVDKDSFQPRILFDESGGLHASWLENRIGSTDYHLFYAYYADGQFVEDQEQLVYSPVVSITSGFSGPELGLDGEHAYLMWSEAARTGLSAGQVSSHFVSLPYGGGESEPVEKNLPFPFGYDLNYSETSSLLQAGERAFQADQHFFPNPNLTDIYANPLQSGELVVAVRSRLPFLRNKQASQVGLVFLDDEQVSNYQLLSLTPGISELPSVQADAEGYLYASWLEKTQSGEYRLYYSSTAPAPRAALDELGNEDAVQLTGQSLFGLLSGIVLIPFPILWGAGPMVLTLVTGFLRQEEEGITAPGTLFTLVLGVVVYTFVKIFTLPGMISYVPFSAWIPILPESLFEPLRIGTPILIGLVGLYFAWRQTYKRRNNAPLFFMLYFAAMDGMLSIAIYGVLVYGAT